jgi:hypothetical protein
LETKTMTGLDLESFLLLLRADLTTWVVLGLASVGLALLFWLCWGSRRALRKCLVLSLAAHLGIVLYGSTVPAVRSAMRGESSESEDRSHIRRIRVAPLVESANPTAGGASMTRERDKAADGAGSPGSSPRLKLAAAPLRLADVALHAPRPTVADQADAEPGSNPPTPIALGTATPQPPVPAPEPPVAGPRSEVNPPLDGVPPVPPSPLPPNLAEVEREPAASPAETSPSRRERAGSVAEALGTRDMTLRSDVRLRPGRTDQSVAESPASRVAPPMRTGPMPSAATDAGPAPAQSGPGTEPGRIEAKPSVGSPAPPATDPDRALALDRVTPKARATPGGGSGLASLDERPVGRTIAEVPRVYQPRLDPDRPKRAQRDGASAASERAVERALDWLARHQDPDGRWDAGTARYKDGTPAEGEKDSTKHCPVGETCFGECAYWEADSAMTGLALLTYLGAGYTHTSGRYAETVGKGLKFLMAEQKPDGDLRGRSQVVGMYCHAMATLALCEGYALTGDPRVGESATRAVAFLVRSRARDGLAWRYMPGATVGDTSILGWVVMGLKSAKEVGVAIPDEASVRRGTLTWLDKVASGQAKGLASYQPSEKVTPTMTAEAWVCRQFLGVGGPGPASDEAAKFLLDNPSDRGATNFYYWYYATLALYQHGGEPWSRWNAEVRDRIVGLQRSSGHQAGSWDPDKSIYGAKGGRIYCTTLAALSLEVYYRYLRLYDDPKIPSEEPDASLDIEPRRREPPATAINPEDR